MNIGGIHAEILRGKSRDGPAVLETHILYDQCLENMARLSGFAQWNSQPPGGMINDEISHFAMTLAKRDLITFAASFRNFIEHTDTTNIAKTVQIRTSESELDLNDMSVSDGPSINIYRLLSRILHSVVIDIRFEVNLYDHYHFDDFMQFYNAQMTVNNRGYKSGTLVFLKSKKDGNTRFFIQRLLNSGSVFFKIILEDRRFSDKIFEKTIRDT